jgi:hypothetical protein
MTWRDYGCFMLGVVLACLFWVLALAYLGKIGGAP